MMAGSQREEKTKKQQKDLYKENLKPKAKDSSVNMSIWRKHSVFIVYLHYFLGGWGEVVDGWKTKKGTPQKEAKKNDLFFWAEIKCKQFL